MDFQFQITDSWIEIPVPISLCINPIPNYQFETAQNQSSINNRPKTSDQVKCMLVSKVEGL